VIANEVVSGDYVDADDELSLKNVIAQMFETQKENSAQFDNNTWNSVFWDPMDARPDLITKEVNKFFFYNQTDHRFYKTDSSSSSTSGSVSILKDLFGGSGSHGSTSSMTQDDITHLLEQYNIESEFDGQKWVPKKLTLNRLNVNDLNRKDILTTTRMRVRQVEIAGALQVGVQNANRDKLDDENRYLRQQLMDLQTDLASAKNMFTQEIVALQTGLASVTQELNKQQDFSKFLQGCVADLQNYKTTAQTEIVALQNQAKNIHIDQCQEHENSAAEGFGAECPSGKYLRNAKFMTANDYLFRVHSVLCC
jgi:hypothetical protein